MRDVPDDIQQKAEAIKEACHDRVVRWEGSPDTFTALVDEIAEALKDERARCAKIARMWLADWEGLPIDNVPAGKYAADAVKDILDAIRRG